MSETTPSMMIAVAAGASLAAAILDVRSYRVPNWLTLPLLGSGLLFRLAWGGPPWLGDGLLGAVFGFGALIWVHAMGGMGAGDVKLASGIGAWLGFSMTWHVLLGAAIAGGVFSLVLAVATGRLFEVVAAVPVFGPKLMGVPAPDPTTREGLAEELKKPGRRGRVVPFAAMIAAGMAATLALR